MTPFLTGHARRKIRFEHILTGARGDLQLWCLHSHLVKLRLPPVLQQEPPVVPNDQLAMLGTMFPRPLIRS